MKNRWLFILSWLMPSVFATSHPNPLSGLGNIFQGLITLIMSIVAGFSYISVNPQAAVSAGPTTAMQIGAMNLFIYILGVALILWLFDNVSWLGSAVTNDWLKRVIVYVFPLLMILGISAVTNVAGIAQFMSGILLLLLVLALLAIPCYLLWNYWSTHGGSMGAGALVAFGVALVIVSLLANGLLCIAVPAASFCSAATSNIQSGNSNSFNTIMVFGGCDGTCPDPTPAQSCANGATNYPDCNQCKAGETFNPTTQKCETPAPVPGGVCGDGVVNPGEDCEPSVFNQESYIKRQCKTPNLVGDVKCYAVGTANECKFDTRNCRSCASGETVKNAGSWNAKRECVSGGNGGGNGSGNDGGNGAAEAQPPPCEISCPGFSSWANVGKGYGETYKGFTGKTYRRCMPDSHKTKNVGKINGVKKTCLDICKDKALFDAKGKGDGWMSGTGWGGCASGIRVVSN